MRIYYWLLPPSGYHRSFRLMSKKDGKHIQMYDARLDNINKLFKNNVLDQHQAHLQAKKILLELRGKQIFVKEFQCLDINQAILDRFFEEEYAARDILETSRQTALAGARRALDMLKHHPLLTVTPNAVQKLLNEKPYKSRAPIVLALNSLFAFIGRKERFTSGRNKTIDKVSYLSLSDFEKVLPYVENEMIRNIAGAAFCTGCRVGELFSLSQYSQIKKRVIVVSQIDRTKIERPTKTYKKRETAVVVALEPYLLRWLNTSIENRLLMRNSRISDILKEACKKAFPEHPSKWIHFYGLRHSYAIFFAELGLSAGQISQNMGNSETVCRNSYIGHFASDAVLDRMITAQPK